MNKIINTELINALGLDKLPKEKQNETLLKFGEMIFQGIIAKVLAQMEEKDAEEFGRMLDSAKSDDESVWKFLQEKVPNLDEISASAIEEFKQKCVNVFGLKED